MDGHNNYYTGCQAGGFASVVINFYCSHHNINQNNQNFSTVCKMLLTELSLSWLRQEEKLYFKESNSKMNGMTPECLNTRQELYCLQREMMM